MMLFLRETPDYSVKLRGKKDTPFEIPEVS
jgi:hypothetical protein